MTSLRDSRKAQLQNAIASGDRTHTEPHALASGTRSLSCPTKPDRPYIEEITLYNLKDDIGETTNVAKEHPQIVANLMKQIDFAKQDVGYHDKIGKNSRRKRQESDK